MNDELAFVEQVRLAPHDDTPRLIYADYLDDAGDPQGELIRLQVELANLPIEDERRVALAARESELLEEFGETWLAPLRALGAIGVTPRSFQRGLIERVRIDTRQFFETADELCRIAPALHVIELRNPRDVVETLVAMAIPPQITVVDLSASRLDAQSMSLLRLAPWLRHIAGLNLQFNALRDEGVQQLVLAEMPNLRSLFLGINQIGPPGAHALAAWPSLAGVEKLSLRVNPIGDIGIERLASSSLIGNLRSLDVASCQITARGALAIWNSTQFPPLDELVLSGNDIPQSYQRHPSDSHRSI